MDTVDHSFFSDENIIMWRFIFIFDIHRFLFSCSNGLKILDLFFYYVGNRKSLLHGAKQVWTQVCFPYISPVTIISDDNGGKGARVSREEIFQSLSDATRIVSCWISGVLQHPESFRDNSNAHATNAEFLHETNPPRPVLDRNLSIISEIILANVQVVFPLWNKNQLYVHSTLTMNVALSWEIYSLYSARDTWQEQVQLEIGLFISGRASCIVRPVLYTARDSDTSHYIAD